MSVDILCSSSGGSVTFYSQPLRGSSSTRVGTYLSSQWSNSGIGTVSIFGTSSNWGCCSNGNFFAVSQWKDSTSGVGVLPTFQGQGTVTVNLYALYQTLYYSFTVNVVQLNPTVSQILLLFTLFTFCFKKGEVGTAGGTSVIIIVSGNIIQTSSTPNYQCRFGSA